MIGRMRKASDFFKWFFRINVWYKHSEKYTREIQMRDCVLMFLLGATLTGIVFMSGCAKKSSQEGVVELRYENWEVYPAQLKAHREVVEKFNQIHSGIHINFQPVDGGPQKILVEMGGGTAPDIFFWCDTILPPLVEKKAVINLRPFIEKDKEFNLSQYFPHILDGLRYGKGIYGLPIYFGTGALVYNKSLFDKEKICYPTEDWTWGDFLRAAQKLTKRKDKRRVQFGALPLSYELIQSFGGDFFDQDGTKCILNSPETKEALHFLVDLQNKYRVVPSMTELESGSFNLKEKSGVALFMTGRVGMFVASSFLLPTLNDIKSFEWDVAPMPIKEGRKRVSASGTGTLHISSQCKHPREAWEFVKFACGKDGTTILGRAKNCVPPIPEVAYTTFCTPPPEHIRVYVDAVNYIIPNLKVTWYDEFFALVVRPQVELLLLGKQSVEETINKIVTEGNKYVKRK